jgi:hypothetical protein
MVVAGPARRRRQVACRPQVNSLEGRVLLSRPAPNVLREPSAIVRIAVPDRSHASPPASELMTGTEIRPHASEWRVGLAAGPGQVRSKVDRWSWLAGTYWYVPTANLPSIRYSTTSGLLTAQMDQTVFQITGSSQGYIWGVAVTQFSSSRSTTSTLLGSVTPEGRVLLNFLPGGGSSGETVVQGFGQMRRERGRWTMENQMFSDPSSQLQIGHWAYMAPTRPGMRSWDSLPGVGVSVPEFLGQSVSQAPRTVGR